MSVMNKTFFLCLAAAFLASCDRPRIPAGDANVIEERIRPVAKMVVVQGETSATAATAVATTPVPAQPSGNNGGAKAAITAKASFNPEQIYKTVCSACHATGLAGAPKFGDAAAWKPRIAQGMAAVMKIVINGKGAMPPRGGTQLSDGELKQVAEYMISKSK